MFYLRHIKLAPNVATTGGPASETDMVTLPLAKLVKGLPDSLKAFIAKPPAADATVAFPITRIMPQLAKGAIKVTYGELAEAAPAGVFLPSPNQDDTPVSLPLKDVLPQLSSAMKRKRSSQATGVPTQNFFGSAASPPPPTSPPVAPPAAAITQPQPSPKPAPPATAPDGYASIPLAKILPGLPDECRALLTQPPPADAAVQLPATKLAPQLPKGRVTITFAELVAAAPAGTFAPPGGQAETPVKLPLGDVLAQIGPGALKRKEPIKKLEGLEKQDFFGAGRPAAAETPAATSPPPAATSTTFAPQQPAFAPVTAPATTFQPVAPTSTAAPARASAAPSATPLTAPEGQVALHLSNLLTTLPDELGALVATPPAPDATILLAADRLAPQLAKGRISITLKELAEAAPVGTFANVAGHESQPVSLPLADVLAQIGPGALKRKEPVKKLEGIANQDFFGGTAQISRQQEEASPPAEPPTFAPSPGPTADTGTGYTTFEPKPVPAAPVSGGSTVFVPAESAPPLDEPPAATPAASTSTRVAIPVSKLAERWSPQLKADMTRLADNTVIEFPSEELGHSLKTGRVQFTWSQLRNWSKPRTSLSSPALDAAGTLDIPLRAVVGPFMAAMRGKPAPSSESGGAPPDVAPATVASPAATPSQATPASASPGLAGISMTSSKPAASVSNVFVPPLTAPAGADIAPGDATLGDLLGVPGKDNWTPVEIVKRVAGLPAVAGAMLSLFEGQIAAAELPEGRQTAAIARRLPQLYNAANEEIRQMELEPLNFLSFATAGTPWLVFKLGNIFFTVQGRPGEHLPVSRLESIAVQVGKQCR